MYNFNAFTVYVEYIDIFISIVFSDFIFGNFISAAFYGSYAFIYLYLPGEFLII